MIQYFPSSSCIVDEKQSATISVQQSVKGSMKIRVASAKILPNSHKRFINGYIAVELSPAEYAQLITK